MAEDWDNVRYTKNWMKEPRKMPPWVSFGLKKNEQAQPDKIFEIALQPPMCYPKGNSSNRINLGMNHPDYVRSLNQTWMLYCDMGYKLDQEIKRNGLNFDSDLKTRIGQYSPTNNEIKQVQSKIKDLSDLWHK